MEPIPAGMLAVGIPQYRLPRDLIAAAVVPNTPMPEMGLADGEAHDLAAYMISLKRKSAPAPTKQLANVHVTGDWQNGQLLYQGMCASCHGPDAQGAIGPQLVNPVFLETVSDATLMEWISQGRVGTQMRPFLRGLQGAAELSRHQIEDIVTYLRYRTGKPSTDGQQIGLGYAPRGRVLFARACAGCHGPEGEGANGPAIRSPAFLAAASDGFLRATIVLGRDGTEMRSMGHHGGGIVEFRPCSAVESRRSSTPPHGTARESGIDGAHCRHVEEHVTDKRPFEMRR